VGRRKEWDVDQIGKVKKGGEALEKSLKLGTRADSEAIRTEDLGRQKGTWRNKVLGGAIGRNGGALGRRARRKYILPKKDHLHET